MALRAEVGRARFVQNNDLAVDDGAFQTLQRRGSHGEIAIFGRPVQPAPGEDAYAGLVNDDLGTVAIELDLVAPVAARGRLGHQLGLHRRNELEPAGAGTYNFTHK